jgi:hypothetical protein
MKLRRLKISITLHLLWPVVFAWTGVPVLLFQAGCGAVGMAAVLGTPTSSETKIPAEYNLARQKDRKILVLVDIPSYLNAYPSMRFLLTDTINKAFQFRAKIQPSFLIDYDTLADFRSDTSDFLLLSPEQVGSALGADLVLLVAVDDYQISQTGEMGGINASLGAHASLVNVATGEKLWPTLEPAKTIHVGFESERGGTDVAAVRLAAAAARCITRYLYDCPKDQFRIQGETADVGWEK